MQEPDPGELPDLLQLVLAYSRPEHRAAWHAYFALDAHLANLLRGTTEPLLGQIRLAWWRDRLREDSAEWPRGNPLLCLIERGWQAEALGLAALVDGWEHLLAQPPIAGADITGFARGRADAMRSLADLIEAGEAGEAITLAAGRWALADLLEHSQAEEERQAITAEMVKLGTRPVRLPRSMRPLAILDGLAVRSRKAGETQMFAGRSAALAALRLGMFGR